MGKLRKFTKEEIKKIIENHQHWLKEDCEGWENMKADLSYADLNKKDLSFTDLRGVTLSHATLNHADLSCSNLKGATLSYVDLSYANLYSAEFYKANLRSANLSHANLRFANLRSANLKFANLENANLMSAALNGANLYNANLENAKINYPFACPSKGSFTAWEKANGKIVKLQILEDSKRLSATTDKCRCDKALVLEIQDFDGNKLDIESVKSSYDKNFIYKVGEIVEVKDFDEDRWNECSTGIHFFVDRQSAVNY